MKLPQVRYRPWSQTQLWEDSKRVHGRYGAATVIGDFYEEATAQLLNIQRLTTDSSCDLCPDHDGSGFFVECKACRQDRGVYLLYNLEMTGYRNWLRTFRGKPNAPKLYYTLWSYETYPKPSEFRWRDDLWDTLALGTLQCVVLDFSTVRQLFKRTKQEKGNWSSYSDFGFRRIRLGRFREFDHWRCWMMREGVEIEQPIYSKKEWTGRIYGREVGPVPVYMLVEGAC